MDDQGYNPNGQTLLVVRNITKVKLELGLENITVYRIV